MLLVADYSQIELRILAHIAGEEAMIEAFRTGRDIHAATAARVFGVAPELVTADQRRAAKVINFGIIYGMSAFGLGKTLRIPPKEADRFIQAYLRALSGRAPLHRGDARARRGARARSRPSTAACDRCPSSPAATTRCARTPAAWRSTPASRAPPPTC